MIPNIDRYERILWNKKLEIGDLPYFLDTSYVTVGWYYIFYTLDRFYNQRKLGFIILALLYTSKDNLTSLANEARVGQLDSTAGHRGNNPR